MSISRSVMKSRLNAIVDSEVLNRVKDKLTFQKTNNKDRSIDALLAGPYLSQNGKVESYTLQHLRVANDAPLGSQDFLILNALHQFKDEKIERVSLGLAPLYQRSNDKFAYSKFAEQIFKTIYRFNCFYNYRTISEHKDHYKAHQEQTFIAVKESFTLRQLFGLLKINNLI